MQTEFRPDVNLPGLGLIEYVQGLMDRPPRLPDEEFLDLVKAAHRAAADEADRLDAIVRGGVS